eukprot:m.10927 g.10927  ORF g.10927 m.10927 type:complete len:239 (-) comp5698_c0_seq1:24-740(-)
MTEPLNFKVLVVGDVSTGKTSLLKRYVHGMFSTTYRATLGVDFAMRTVDCDDGVSITLQFWDIAGQERQRNMSHVYFKGARAALVVFDVSRQSTLDAALEWKREVDTKVFLPNGQPIPCVLIANKADLPRGVGVPDDAAMEEYRAQNGFAFWQAVSALAGTNVDEMVHELVTLLRKGKDEEDMVWDEPAESVDAGTTRTRGKKNDLIATDLVDLNSQTNTLSSRRSINDEERRTGCQC